jgi:hypothetical protein
VAGRCQGGHRPCHTTEGNQRSESGPAKPGMNRTEKKKPRESRCKHQPSRGLPTSRTPGRNPFCERPLAVCLSAPLRCRSGVTPDPANGNLYGRDPSVKQNCYLFFASFSLKFPDLVVAKTSQWFAKIRQGLRLHAMPAPPNLPPSPLGETPRRPKRGETLGRVSGSPSGETEGSDGPTFGSGRCIGAPAMMQNRIQGLRQRRSSGREAANRPLRWPTRLGARASCPMIEWGMRSPERVGAPAPAFSGLSLLKPADFRAGHPSHRPRRLTRSHDILCRPGTDAGRPGLPPHSTRSVWAGASLIVPADFRAGHPSHRPRRLTRFHDMLCRPGTDAGRPGLPPHSTRRYVANHIRVIPRGYGSPP